MNLRYLLSLLPSTHLCGTIQEFRKSVFRETADHTWRIMEPAIPLVWFTKEPHEEQFTQSLPLLNHELTVTEIATQENHVFYAIDSPENIEAFRTNVLPVPHKEGPWPLGPGLWLGREHTLSASKPHNVGTSQKNFLILHKIQYNDEITGVFWTELWRKPVFGNTARTIRPQ